MNSHLRIKLILAVVATLLAGCAGGPPKLPYPAFIQVDELEDMFMASLPGVRAKQLSGDPQTRRTSNRVDLPKDWRGTSGGSPGRSLEIFVIDGELSVADVSLTSGGYAYLPAGSLGFNLTADEGAPALCWTGNPPRSLVSARKNCAVIRAVAPRPGLSGCLRGRRKGGSHRVPCVRVT